MVIGRLYKCKCGGNATHRPGDDNGGGMVALLHHDADSGGLGWCCNRERGGGGIGFGKETTEMSKETNKIIGKSI